MSPTHATACMANIGPNERKKRMVAGGVALLVFFVGATVVLWGMESRWWRLPLVLPLLAAALGFFQARERTCVRLAANGTQNLDVGEVSVSDIDFLSRTMEQAQKVWVKSLLATLLIMVALLVLP